MDTEPTRVKDVSNGLTQNIPESKLYSINIQWIGDLEGSNEGNIDGLVLDGSVEVSPLQSMRRNTKK